MITPQRFMFGIPAVCHNFIFLPVASIRAPYPARTKNLETYLLCIALMPVSALPSLVEVEINSPETGIHSDFCLTQLSSICRHKLYFSYADT
jgi:hypothetical protein